MAADHIPSFGQFGLDAVREAVPDTGLARGHERVEIVVPKVLRSSSGNPPCEPRMLPSLLRVPFTMRALTFLA